MNRPLSHSFGRITNWFTIVGAIVSAYFAWKSVQLTIKYGESQEQINRLDTIASNRQAQIDHISNVNMFTTAFYNIDRHHNLLVDKNLLDSNQESTKLQFLLDMRTLVESQLSNPYLLEDKDLQLTWISFQTSIKNYEDILREGDVSVQITDGKNPNLPANVEDIKKFRRQWFKIFNKQYLDFYFPTLEKLTKDNEMPYQKKKKKKK